MIIIIILIIIIITLAIIIIIIIIVVVIIIIIIIIIWMTTIATGFHDATPSFPDTHSLDSEASNGKLLTFIKNSENSKKSFIFFCQIMKSWLFWNFWDAFEKIWIFVTSERPGTEHASF